MEDPNVYIMLSFLMFLNQIKLYHWQTFNFARHKATDELYSELNDLIDKFIEVLQGKTIFQNKKYRITLNGKNSIPLKNITDDEAYKLISSIKTFLESDQTLLSILNSSTDLTNIRDEMLASINKISFLFSLN